MFGIDCAIKYTRYMSSSAKNSAMALVEAALDRYSPLKGYIIGRMSVEQVLWPPEQKEGPGGTRSRICYRCSNDLIKSLLDRSTNSKLIHAETLPKERLGKELQGLEDGRKVNKQTGIFAESG